MDFDFFLDFAFSLPVVLKEVGFLIYLSIFDFFPLSPIRGQGGLEPISCYYGPEMGYTTGY